MGKCNSDIKITKITTGNNNQINDFTEILADVTQKLAKRQLLLNCSDNYIPPRIDEIQNSIYLEPTTTNEIKQVIKSFKLITFKSVYNIAMITVKDLKETLAPLITAI